MSVPTVREQVSQAVERSLKAWRSYKTASLEQRARLLYRIAERMQMQKDRLVQLAVEDSHLPADRMETEFLRTLYQLRSYADACREGAWMDIRIDTTPKKGVNASNPAAVSDLRKMMVPLGPVVVFGASNFPFAYSTAGGDTGGAIAAGNTVIVKAHPAHLATSTAVGELICLAAEDEGWPKDCFIHLEAPELEWGRELVLHPSVMAVGFTGSFSGGKALMDLAASRPQPIPVFAEMGSVNPVFILPQKMKEGPTQLAGDLSVSMLQSVGQFCTNPGVLVIQENEAMETFIQHLTNLIQMAPRQLMLHPGIAENFSSNRKKVLDSNGVELLTQHAERIEGHSLPTLARINANEFASNPDVRQEVFGPFSILVICKGLNEMMTVAQSLEGQLTCTIQASTHESSSASTLASLLQDKCGRLIFNGVPTGVQVSWAMHHGGPFPAASDSRFTAVGPDNIRRFARPVSFQNWPHSLLPPELQNENPLHLWRCIDGTFTRDAL